MVTLVRSSLSSSVPSVIFAGLFLLATLTLSASPACGITIATFADPAADASTPLFTVTYGSSGSVAGGWDDSQTGLALQVPITGDTYQDAFFTMTTLAYAGDSSGGATGPGTLKFFDDGDDPGAAQPLVMFTFDSAQIDPGGLYADNIFHANSVQVTIKGYAQTLTDQQFSFAFVHKTFFGGDIPAGFTATASFTSSAVPEPASILLLALGSLALLRKRKH